LPNFIINWKLLKIKSTRLFLEVVGSLQEETCPRISAEFKLNDSHTQRNIEKHIPNSNKKKSNV